MCVSKVSESTKNASTLFGFKHIVDYLKKLGNKNIELIFKYAKRVIESDPNSGLKIFTSGGDPTKIDELLVKKIVDKEEGLNKNRPKNSTAQTAGPLTNGHVHAKKGTNPNSSKVFSSDTSFDDFEIDDDDTVKALNHKLVCQFFTEQIENKHVSVYFLRIYLQYCLYIWNDTDSYLNNLLVDTYKSLMEDESLNKESFKAFQSANRIQSLDHSWVGFFNNMDQIVASFDIFCFI